MPEYTGQPDYQHGSEERLGVLLVNLGTPDAATPAAVRQFLAEFLWDPRVVETPRWVWWLALHGVILRVRPRKSTHAYEQIWTPRGSPLLIHSRALAERLDGVLKQRLGATVALGMSYGSPSIPAALAQLRNAGMRRLVVLPLYPQYSGTTTASVFDRVTAQLQRWRWVPEMRFIGSYHEDDGYIDAVSSSIRERWQTHERAHLLFSFHGIPRRYVLAGDPYHCQSLKSARLIAEKLGLQDDEWSVSFQSQVGREEWLRPYTDEWLLQAARAGRRRVTVVCPGFATDCLETLEEIAIRNREAFVAAGGEYYDYVPALNESDAQVQTLAHLVERHASGWPETGSGHRATPEDREMSRQRALARGAAR